MAGYKALFVGEQKVKKVRWSSREDAARHIVRDGLSVLNVYETTQGRQYFDVSDKIAHLISVGYASVSLTDNVRDFVKRAKIK